MAIFFGSLALLGGSQPSVQASDLILVASVLLLLLYGMIMKIPPIDIDIDIDIDKIASISIHKSRMGGRRAP
jgi:hypothetical protein